MSFLLERDAVNGKEGRGFMTIDGENHEMFGLKSSSRTQSFRKQTLRWWGPGWYRKRPQALP